MGLGHPAPPCAATRVPRAAQRVQAPRREGTCAAHFIQQRLQRRILGLQSRRLPLQPLCYWVKDGALLLSPPPPPFPPHQALPAAARTWVAKMYFGLGPRFPFL